MGGFVGSRARKRRRNIFLTLGFLVLIVAIYFMLPTFQLNINDPIPDEDQKIKFRDGQINNLQNQLKDTKMQLEITIKELNKIKDLYETLTLNSNNSVPSDELNILQNKFNALNKENEKNISKINDLNNQIKDLDNSLLSVDQNQKDASIENQKLKKDNKSLFAKNLKLNQTISNLENKINEQNIELNIYLEQIKELKDRSHHGG